MRLLATIIGFSVVATVQAQTENPYLRIETAVAQSQQQANVIVEATGWQSAERRVERFHMRLYTSGGKVYAEQFVDSTRRLIIVADGSKVWRYDPILNEHTFMAQPETFEKTMSLVTAWSRKHLQRPVRALGGSVRWFTIPQFDDQESHVRVFQTRAISNDWRGTDAYFFLDDRARIDRITIEDKLDKTAGLEHTWLEATFTYPASIPVEFSFKPPVGSKPAADLPVRISGDGG